MPRTYRTFCHPVYELVQLITLLTQTNVVVNYVLQEILPALCVLIHHTDINILVDTVWALR